MIFVLLAHGSKINSEVIGIDTEDLIRLQDAFYSGWCQTGRQGLVFLKLLMNQWTLQPYVAAVLTVIFFGTAVMVYFCLWDQCCNRKSIMAWILGGGFWIFHPIMTEQFYFTLQSVEICVAFLLVAFSLLFLVQHDWSSGRWRVLFPFCCLLVSFSVYQVFVLVFVFGTVSILFLNGIRKMRCQEKLFFKEVIPYFLVFISAFFVNWIATKLFFNESDYLNSMILWKSDVVWENIRAIIGHVVKVFTGYDVIYYHFSFGILFVFSCFLLYRFCRTYGRGDKKSVGLMWFYLCALLSTPFLMSLVCGGAPVIRSQLVLPILTGFLAYVDMVLLEDDYKLNKKISTFFVVVCLIGVFSETKTTMSLYYTEKMCYEQDEFLGRELIQEIDRVRDGAELEVAIIGSIPFHGNHACVKGETIGKSFFEYDKDIEPVYYWSTRRILGFLHILGANYPQANFESFEVARLASKDMPVWPEKGSVVIENNVLIVKLSECEY